VKTAMVIGPRKIRDGSDWGEIVSPFLRDAAKCLRLVLAANLFLRDGILKPKRTICSFASAVVFPAARQPHVGTDGPVTGRPP